MTGITGMTGLKGMSAVNRWRIGVGACGLAAGLYGAIVMVQSGPGNILRTLYWLVGGVVAHDGLLAPVTLAVVVIASRLLPDWARGPAAIGLVVLGSLTLLAIPVLGRFGATSANPTLLDRNYTAGWLAVAAITLAGVAVGSVVVRRRATRAADPSAPARPGEDAQR